MTSPVSIVESQLCAYNARDIEAFAATFAADVIVFDLEGQDLASAAVRFRGIGALRERYGSQFRDLPKQHSTVVSRNAVGDYVFDLEFITGVPGRPDCHLMAIYRVRPGPDGILRIDRAWFTPRV